MRLPDEGIPYEDLFTNQTRLPGFPQFEPIRNLNTAAPLLPPRACRGTALVQLWHQPMPIGAQASSLFSQTSLSKCA